MIRLCLALFLACLALAAPAGAQGRGDSVRIKPVQIAIREGPGTGFPAVATVYKGDELPVLQSRGNWLLVAVRRGGGKVEGWLNAAFAEEVEQDRGRPGRNWPDRGGWTDERPGRDGAPHWDRDSPWPPQGGSGSSSPSWQPEVTGAPDRFAGAAALSAAFRTDAQLLSLSPEGYESRYGGVLGYGLEGGDRANAAWEALRPETLAAGTDAARFRRVPRLYFDIGADDPFFEGTAALHVALRDAGLRHRFRVTEGGHDWPFWRGALEEALRHADAVLTRGYGE
ncbi:SH3 domain-containing protein [Mangrovicoccus ximenensis]|uniref:SH3 domain-containing protein n=1 Tax=Mangrovicoccus ximenensis TaxID=1911570 RepID=UPI000D3D334D|nr:SH3 domain-containing protein [Mangrovicoccus ximenensis]